jgi:hypothetical protein
MRKVESMFACAIFAIATFVAPAAQAQNTRSFVSGHGSDTNSCTLAAPCRSFQRAHDETAANGEISVLDSAGYGSLMISKAISIVNPGGVEAGIAVASGGTAIYISAGPNDVVNLRGLIIDGGGIGATGIAFQSGKSLTIENVVVRNLTSSGLAFAPTTQSTMTVSNSFIAHNGGHGIYVQPSAFGANFTAVFTRVEVYNSGLMGIAVYANEDDSGRIKAIAIDCVSASNGQHGYYALGGSGSATAGVVEFDIFRSVAFNNGNYGVYSDNALMNVSLSNLEGNNSGPWNTNGNASIGTYGNNFTYGNTVPMNGENVMPR